MELKVWQTILLIGICISTLVYTGYRSSAESEVLNNGDFLRFHVVANSDTDSDQSLKLTVRDGIIEEINSFILKEIMAKPVEFQGEQVDSMKVSLSLEDSKIFVANNLEMIENTATNIMISQGYEYDVKVDLGVRWIPEKTYDDITFPAGNYEALTVTIGEGNGENWWCVLFPPLCLIGIEPPESLDDKYAPLINTSGEETTLKIKFKTLEILEGK